MSLPRHAGRVASPRRLRVVRVRIAGLLASVLALSLLDALSLELVFVCSLIVLLVATELTDLLATTPPPIASSGSAERDVAS